MKPAELRVAIRRRAGVAHKRRFRDPVVAAEAKQLQLTARLYDLRGRWGDVVDRACRGNPAARRRFLAEWDASSPNAAEIARVKHRCAVNRTALARLRPVATARRA